MRDFNKLLKSMEDWNSRGWNHEQMSIGIALYNLFMMYSKDVKDTYDCSENLESFHKAFRQTPVTDQYHIDIAIWNLIGISGHFWNAAQGKDEWDELDDDFTSTAIGENK